MHLDPRWNTASIWCWLHCGANVPSDAGTGAVATRWAACRTSEDLEGLTVDEGLKR
jgi:hypothetical protein